MQPSLHTTITLPDHLLIVGHYNIDFCAGNLALAIRHVIVHRVETAIATSETLGLNCKAGFIRLINGRALCILLVSLVGEDCRNGIDLLSSTTDIFTGQATICEKI
jgi:hypothetical protein